MLNMIFQGFNEARRRFEYDYIYIDALFLIIWITILIKKKKWNPLKFGLLTGFIVYFIDCILWWNLPAGSNYPPGTTIREYWIGGLKIPTSLGNYFWPKFGSDFMMTFSYSMFIFSWIWIMFENYVKRNLKEIIGYTLLFFTAWTLTPFLSLILPLNNTIVETVRHMDSQILVWQVNVGIGYLLLFLIYGTNWFKSKDLRVIGYVFVLGCIGSFFMEFPLLISGIRPTGIIFLLYEVVILFNQGAPYLYILYDKIFPWISYKIKNRIPDKEIEMAIEL